MVWRRKKRWKMENMGEGSVGQRCNLFKCATWTYFCKKTVSTHVCLVAAKLCIVLYIKQTTAKQDSLEQILLELSSTAKSSRPIGYMVTVTCGLRPPLWFDVWILGYLMLLFQVSLTGQDSKQISHKYFNCSAERHLQSPAPLCALYVLYPAVGAFHVGLVPSSGVCVELQDLFCYFLFFSVEVTALVFFFSFIHSDNGVVSDWDLNSCE